MDAKTRKSSAQLALEWRGKARDGFETGGATVPPPLCQNPSFSKRARRWVPDAHMQVLNNNVLLDSAIDLDL